MAKLSGLAERYVNLALPEHGGAICSVSDEFFAPAKRMLSAEPPIFVADKYDAHGKWMDGWESRRKRSKGHDYCVLRICPGVIHAIEIDTSYFTGNFAPAISLQACWVDIEPDEDTNWTELIAPSVLVGDSQKTFTVNDERCWSHLRLNLFPDGGVARLRVYGQPQQFDHTTERDLWTDLSSTDVGGEALQCNNMHFGHMSNLLLTRPVANMGDGWETRRRRQPGNDWVILKLGRKGQIGRVEVDTAFFRGNYPARCSLKAAALTTDVDIERDSVRWAEALPQIALGPDQLHIFESQVIDVGNVTHVRLDIYPDGGVARLKLLGLIVNDYSA